MSKITKTKCNKCGKSEHCPEYWATLRYEDTFGNNDGAGACVDHTDETFDLCVECKQKFYQWINNKGG